MAVTNFIKARNQIYFLRTGLVIGHIKGLALTVYTHKLYVNTLSNCITRSDQIYYANIDIESGYFLIVIYARLDIKCFVSIIYIYIYIKQFNANTVDYFLVNLIGRFSRNLEGKIAI